MTDFRIEWAAQSDVGRQRDHNEDSFLADEFEGLWVVADGMGGHQGGEDASLLACQGIHEYVVGLSTDPGYIERYELHSNLPPEARAFGAAVRYANERIFVEALKDPSKEGMGTTVVTVLKDDNNLILAHVGDSRIYRYRPPLLEQVTFDHSLVNHLLATGQITPEQVRGYPQGNVILRALGLREDVEVDVQLQPMFEGDTYLLCSDGLTDMVDDMAIEQILLEHPYDLAAACNNFVMLANANGGRDNITVCLLRICPLPQQPTVTL